MHQKTRITLALCLSGTALAAHAGASGPAAQYWIDLSTASMSIPGMPEGGMFGAQMGGGRGKFLQTALQVRAQPAGVEGVHAIPPAMNMGQSLLLVPVKPVAASQGSATYRSEPADKPKGRILLYWGCGNAVRPGQPKVIDLASRNVGEFAHFFASHGGSLGAQARPGDAVWPNARDSKEVPDNASLQGEHAISGDGVPANLKFAIGEANDFLPKVRLTTKGLPQDGVQVGWQTMQYAKGYFLRAQGSATGASGDDMILWSSSERPDNGWSLMTYQSPAQIAKLLQQKVILPPSAANCTVPKGIFDKAEGAMLNMIAYGPELNLSHPVRPAKAPAGWQPEWTARVRVKSTGTTMLGMEGGPDQDSGAEQSDSGSAPAPLNFLKGIFSR